MSTVVNERPQSLFLNSMSAVYWLTVDGHGVSVPMPL